MGALPNPQSLRYRWRDHAPTTTDEGQPDGLGEAKGREIALCLSNGCPNSWAAREDQAETSVSKQSAARDLGPSLAQDQTAGLDRDPP